MFPLYTKTKDSGVEWLGKVAEHWTVKRLGHFFTERREKVSDKNFAPLSVTKNGVVPQLETAAKTDDGDNRKKVCVGDFVVNGRSDRKGSSGVSGISGSVSLINIVLTPRNINTQFVHHLLRSYPFQEEFYRYGKGIVADLWSTNYSEMRNILLALPEISEQTALASFLDRKTALIDDLIAKRERQVELLQEQRTALISRAVTKGLNPAVPMKDSGVEWLGKVPEHWRVGALKYYTQIIGRIGWKGYTTQDLRESGALVLGASHITNANKIDISKPVYLSQEKYLESPEIQLKGGELLAVKVGATIGRVGRVPEGLGSATINPNVMIIKPIMVDSFFLSFLLSASFYRNSFISMSMAGAQQAINQEFVANIPSLCPPRNEQQTIALFLERETAKIDTFVTKVQQSIEKLREYRQSLISAAVTGKIDVRNWQSSSEPAEESLHA